MAKRSRKNLQPISRAGKREVKQGIVQDEGGRGIPVFVLRPLRGQRLKITTTITTTIEVEEKSKEVPKK